jgi:hypothetical protein
MTSIPYPVGQKLTPPEGSTQDPKVNHAEESEIGSSLSGSEDLHDGARHAPHQKRALANTHLNQMIPTGRVSQAESGEREVRFTPASEFWEDRPVDVFAHHALCIGHSAARH